MIFNEAYDYLFNQLAGSNDAGAITRLKDYQRKRLRRALLARSSKPYFLQADWTQVTGLEGEEIVALTEPIGKPLLVLDGAIRTTDIAAAGTADNNNFELNLYRTAGDSQPQIQIGRIKDECLLTPSQAAIRPTLLGMSAALGTLGQGAPWPLTWPVPMRLRENELLQVQSKVLAGGVPANETTFCRFRALAIENRAEDDKFIQELTDYIKAHPKQFPVYLSMYSTNARSITFPATGLLQRTTAKTREAEDHLLVVGYAALFARGIAGQLGTTCNPRWRLQSSNGHSFSKEEIDINTYAYAGPGFFWNEMPCPFLLPKGSSLSASFSTLTAIANATEQIDNYVIFRCVTV